ncbi:dienelactone hydrolase family protein [soil metagenome]
MADVILFHHAQGLTEGMRSFAQKLRDAGHRVTVPDLYDGSTFDDLDEGVAHARSLGDAVDERAFAAVEGLPDALVTMGFSLGIMPAQQLAQTRPGVVGCVLFTEAIPTAEFGTAWPAGVALQVHIQEDDPWGDPAAAAQVVAEAADGELFTYPGAGHLVADSSLASYEPALAGPMLERTLAFLSRW